MEYDKIADSLSEKAGINRELFNLDFDIKEGEGYVLSSSQSSNHYYYSKVEHWENTKERWKSTVLYVPRENIQEFVSILNNIFEENKEKSIDLANIPESIEYYSDDKSFNILLIQSEKYHYRVELAKKSEY